MITGNKGEWSEIYALFKLLGDRELRPGNNEVERIQNLIYPILKILRTEGTRRFEYSIEDDIVVVSDHEVVSSISVSEFQEKAMVLLAEIKANSGTFSLPEIEEFMRSINCLSLKARSSRKTDITIVVHDQRTGEQPSLGFSIKSQLGNPSTLLNAGETTNFIYKITGVELTSSEIEGINAISTKYKIKDRVNAIKSKGGSFEFVKPQREIFNNNLVLIDSLLPQVLSFIVLGFYSSSFSSSEKLIRFVERENPLKFDTSSGHPFYRYKIKRFLTDIALGMMPSRVWTGEYDATGGYLIVKDDGEVLCYHIYNRNVFEDYLLSNTKLDTAGSTRHKFGKIYKKDGELYFNMNLQIRFL